MAKDKSLDAMTKIVETLTPLPQEERARVLQAAMLLLGETPVKPTAVADNLDQANSDLPPRARAWMKQNGITAEQVQQVFHIADGSAEIIAAHMPGKNRKEQTYSAYMLTGIGQLLATGVPSFQDRAARMECERSGCYDSANHSAHLKNKGNEFTGTKDKGWVLTAPGLKRGADIIKEMQGTS